MTTDITKLAPAMKAAAEKATPGEWRYLKTTPFMDAEISAANNTRVVNLLAGDVTEANSAFIALANPANVLALVEALEKSEKTSEARREAIDRTHNMFVRERDRANAAEEALEKAQTEVKRQENIASALFDEVSQLRRNADDKAPELKKIITEMEEENNRQVLEVMRLSSLVAELESRTVTVKMPDYADNGVGETWDDGFNSGIDSTCDAFRSALTAAGIKWEAE